MEGITVAVDFDGTMVEHAFPEVGKNIGAGPVLRAMVKCGCRLILDTMRSDEEPEGADDNGIVIEKQSRRYLQEALEWCKKEHIDLYGVYVNPTQHRWTKSPKCHARLCIDDRNLGTPLTSEGYVDWYQVAFLLRNMGIFDQLSDNDFCKIIDEVEKEQGL